MAPNLFPARRAAKQADSKLDRAATSHYELQSQGRHCPPHLRGRASIRLQKARIEAEEAALWAAYVEGGKDWLLANTHPTR